MMKRTGLLLGAAGLLMSLSVCPTWADNAQLTPQKPRNPNNPFLYAVTWQQTSAEMAALSYQTYRLAEYAIAEKIRLGNFKMRDGLLYEDTLMQAPDGTTFVSSKPLAIVLDLDETVFDNSPYEVFSLKRNSRYDNGYWSYWCRYQAQTPSAQLTMPGSIEFLKKCMEWGVTPIYITNRDMPEREATLQTLKGMGLDSPTLEQQLICRDKQKDKRDALELVKKLGWSEDSPEAAEYLRNASDKAGRRAAVEMRYKVLGYFGDNLYDHPVIVDSSLREKDALRARKEQVKDNADRFGVDWFVLPNITYGSWVKPVIFPERSKSALQMLDDYGFSEWLKQHGPESDRQR
ncbi:MAG: HAD family acid phosphatase [bacterium]|nr:HAD family acid phosphatase [bacterium]